MESDLQTQKKAWSGERGEEPPHNAIIKLGLYCECGCVLWRYAFLVAYFYLSSVQIGTYFSFIILLLDIQEIYPFDSWLILISKWKHF